MCGGSSRGNGRTWGMEGEGKVDGGEGDEMWRVDEAEG